MPVEISDNASVVSSQKKPKKKKPTIQRRNPAHAHVSDAELNKRQTPCRHINLESAFIHYISQAPCPDILLPSIIVE